MDKCPVMYQGWFGLVGEEYRCPLRPLASALGWPVKEPPHLDDDPPRVYVHRRP